MSKHILSKQLQEYILNISHGTNTALCLQNILICILILQYNYNTEPMNILDYITIVVPAIYLSDLISGLIHLVLDVNLLNINELSGITSEFLEHHVSPTDILKGPIVKSFRQSVFVPIPLFLTIFNVVAKTKKKHILSQIVTCYSLSLIQPIHSQAHYMNHATQKQRESIRGKILAFLQDNHIILSPQEHKSHHIGLYDHNFCLINGWANPLTLKITTILKEKCLPLWN